MQARGHADAAHGRRGPGTDESTRRVIMGDHGAGGLDTVYCVPTADGTGRSGPFPQVRLTRRSRARTILLPFASDSSDGYVSLISNFALVSLATIDGPRAYCVLTAYQRGSCQPMTRHHSSRSN